MTIDVLQSVMRSPWPAPLVPDTDFTDHVLRHTARLGSKPALIDAPSGRTITYSGLARDVRRAAAGLAARGFGSGDVLAVHMPNVPEYAVAVHAAMSLGGTVATANPLYTSGELAHQLRDSGARALLTVPPFLTAAREAAGQAGCDDVLVLGEGEGATPFAELFEHGDDPPEVAIDPDSTAALLYSSGTTGVPKGVELSHRALIANVMQTDTVLSLDTRDVVLAVAPFFHALGFAILMNTPLASGATVLSLPRFDLERLPAVGPGLWRDGHDRGPAHRARARPPSGGRALRAVVAALRGLRRRAAGDRGPARVRRTARPVRSSRATA